MSSTDEVLMKFIIFYTIALVKKYHLRVTKNLRRPLKLLRMVTNKHSTIFNVI